MAVASARGAIFFDRDGVLNEDVGYAYRPDQIVWMPSALDAVRLVNQAGLFAFVASNQSGVARGLYGEQDVRSLHKWMNEQLALDGAHIDAFAYSPYHPEGVVEEYRRASSCRKPGPQMLLDLMDKYGVDRARSAMIGDAPSDLAAAEAAGIEGALFVKGGDLYSLVASLVERFR